MDEHKRISIDDLISAFQDANGRGEDMPVSFEDENGREYEFAEVYVYSQEDRYVVVLRANVEESR